MVTPAFSLAGVDGCRGGWLAVRPHEVGGSSPVYLFARFQEILLAFPDLERVAVDMPIGMAEDGGPGRECDWEAKRLLGRRHSCVFLAPSRRVLDAPTYMEANALSKTLYDKGISKQFFNLRPKIREVEEVVRRYGQQMVVEAHPEVCFWAMAGAPVLHSKHTLEGLQARRTLLAAQLGEVFVETCENSLGSIRAKRDDLYDAMAVLWSVRRLALGMAKTIPMNPPKDSIGLRMEINY